MERVLVKKTASSGIATAPAYLYSEPDLSPEAGSIREEQIPEALELFIAARKTVSEELTVLAEKNELFEAHRALAGDFMLRDSVEEKIKKELKNVQQAVSETIEEFAALFAAMDDEYMKERAADIRDIGRRLMSALKCVKRPDLGELKAPVILVARELYPSDTVKINPELVHGIITEEGGVTSHASIIARSLGIPMLVGVREICSGLQDGQLICMDAEEGVIVTDPDEKTVLEYERKKAAFARERRRLKSMRSTPPVTKDGKRILLCVNIGSVQELRNALSKNIDGVGLLRSELLYMRSDHFPTEEEQFAFYKEAASLSPQELTVRTLDIGGDKELPYYKFEKEENPFLGWRAIRISLDMRELFKEQLRAILRAGAYGSVRILIPFVISIEELRETRALIRECERELAAEGLAFDPEMKVGVMIETPASVVLADEFAQEADFFSIGTNDLTQYLLAVDRENKKIAKRYDYFHPAVLKAIGYAIEAGHRAGIPVGMCGEMAGDPAAVKTLLELGLDEFSMAAGCMDAVREQILKG